MLGIGASPNFGAHISGVIRKIHFYPTRPSNARVQALTV